MSEPSTAGSPAAGRTVAGRTVLLAAGGTGGHLFPAESLATVLRRLGVAVVLATDERVGEIARTFPAERVVAIPSATPSGDRF